MKPIPMHFSFKGRRNYVQGADIYSAILRHFESACGAIRLTIHSMAVNDCDLLFTESDNMMARPDKGVADFFIQLRGTKVTGWLVETERPISSRYDYDEERIEAACEISNQSIVVNGDTGYSSIEVVVSMTKQLHNALLFSNDANWIFTRLALLRPLEPGDASSLFISHRHNFKNRLTKSEIFSDRISIGYIYFSLVKL